MLIPEKLTLFYAWQMTLPALPYRARQAILLLSISAATPMVAEPLFSMAIFPRLPWLLTVFLLPPVLTLFLPRRWFLPWLGVQILALFWLCVNTFDRVGGEDGPVGAGLVFTMAIVATLNGAAAILRIAKTLGDAALDG